MERWCARTRMSALAPIIVIRATTANEALPRLKKDRTSQVTGTRVTDRPGCRDPQPYPQVLKNADGGPPGSEHVAETPVVGPSSVDFVMDILVTDVG